MVVIGIDGNEANIEKRVGVNVYAFELLRSIWKLQKKGSINHELIVFLKRPPLSDMPKETQNFKYKIIRGEGLWILTKLMPHLWKNKEKLDVIFSPSHYVPPICLQPRACSIMDLGYLKSSGQFKKYDYWQLKYWSAISIFVSKVVFAISASTRDEIVKRYPFASKKVVVTPLAYDQDLFNIKIAKEDTMRVKYKYTIVSDYILFLSTLKPSKNIEGLIEVFNIISGRFPDIKLVIAGKKGWLYESIFERVKKLKLEDKIIFTDYIPEEDKPALIAGAKIFCLPSFHEGFGLDVLNAMACGVSVVISDKGSLPEVAGDAGVYVDPNSPKSIREGIVKVLSMDDIEYNKLVAKGLEQVKKFSWEITALKTLEALDYVAGQKR
ncbi:MAG: glycosyltransferase family 1 protein [Candidatus Woesebacteria bacterium]|nr:glycosyltransferase family 1 protein [Candidatus Woesebacteria bacterium]